LPADTDIIYIDECGVQKDMKRTHGRSPAGERIYLPVNGHKGEKVNIVAGLLNNRILCPVTYTWNTTGEWFNQWFGLCLCSFLKKGSVIVMDNAAFHKKKDLKLIGESYGCRIIWLPPYSPDKNPIEHYWANLKSWLRLNAKNYTDIEKAMSAYFNLD